jgi:ABC-type transport system substrate-binding protein
LSSLPAPSSPRKPAASRALRAWRAVLAAGALLGACVLAGPCARAADGADAGGAPPQKVLRYALVKPETGLDPVQVSDIYSRELIDNVIEAPLRFDMLAHPSQLRTNTAASLPEMSPDFRQLTLRIRPGIFFTDDPAFHGRPRELTAADYEYALRRNFDPRLHGPGMADLVADDILGLEALYKKAVATNTPFDYDAPVEGLQLLDRYTLRIRFGHPCPRFPMRLAQTLYAGAVAREVAEAYGDAINEHPVGTGPYRLVQWRRSSLIVFERNPHFREDTYDEQPSPGDADGAEIARRLHGRRLPMIDRVEVSIIEEPQPRWLAFLADDFDMAWIPYEFVDAAAPGLRLAPNLAKRGMKLRLMPRPDVVFTYFNMDDPVVGGYAPAQVALRRAIGLGYDNGEEIRLLRRGLAIPAQGVVVPGAAGYDPQLRSEMSAYSPERARALLDLYGYVDRDGDGWRERPDGSPLVVHMATQTDATSRALSELWQKRMQAIQVHMVFDRGQFPEQMKAARAGALQIWFLSNIAAYPDAEESLVLAYGPNKGEGNFSRFDLPAYNAAFEKAHALADGPERAAAIRTAEKLLLAYMPMKAHVHRVWPMITQPWLVGWPSNAFDYGFWRFLDIDAARRPPPR